MLRTRLRPHPGRVLGGRRRARLAGHGVRRDQGVRVGHDPVVRLLATHPHVARRADRTRAGYIGSQFHVRADISAPPPLLTLASSYVAKQAVRAIHRRRPPVVCVPSMRYKVLAGLLRHVPYRLLAVPGPAKDFGSGAAGAHGPDIDIDIETKRAKPSRAGCRRRTARRSPAGRAGPDPESCPGSFPDVEVAEPDPAGRSTSRGGVLAVRRGTTRKTTPTVARFGRTPAWRCAETGDGQSRRSSRPGPRLSR